MKYLVVGDIHGRSLEKLTKVVEREKPLILLCTGDFDRVEQINEFRKLINRYEWQKVLTVPGNHDDAVYNNREIISSEIQKLNATINQLHVNLMRDNQASRFIEKILTSNTRTFEFNEVSSILIHGGLNGDLSSYPACPEEKRNYWFRLKNKEDHRKNFEQMQGRGIKLMIRGHDHEPEFAYLENGEIKRKFPEKPEKFEISNMPVTITHGAWKDGWYAILEDKENVIQIKFDRMED